MKIKCAFLIAASFLIFSFKKSDDHYKGYNVKLQIVNSKNIELANFMVKIADDDQSRAKGLMFINNLPKNYGMLFDFKKEDNVVMWMKNTKIALDMLYINKNNKIVDIKHNATPNSTKYIYSPYKITKLLEINGGLSKELGITTNHYIKIKK